MDWTGVVISWSLVSTIVGATTTVALFMWWLVRIRQRRAWVPVIRVLSLDRTKLPRLKIRPPEWVPFLCFLGAALALVFFSTEPAQRVHSNLSQKKIRNHVFIDMSPSTSARSSVQNLVDLVGETWSQLSESDLSISTSHGPDILRFSHRDQLESHLIQQGYHREGLNIGSAMKIQLEHLEEIDRLFIISDRDSFSWTDFNWKFLLDDTEVFFVDAGNQSSGDYNLFLGRAKYLSAPNAPTMDWDVEVEARGQHEDIMGTLSVSINDRQLADVPWRLDGSKQKVVVRASWPKTALDFKGDGRDHLVWQLEGIADAIEMDNEYRTFARGLGQNILVVADTSGEMILDDPAHQLSVALEILHFRPKRIEWIQDLERYRHHFRVWLVLLDDRSKIDRYCPKELTVERLQVGLGESVTKPIPRIWLAPSSQNQGFRNVCWCYQRLLVSPSTTGEMPDFCRNIYTRSEFNLAMRSLGAAQVGGAVGREEDAFGWIGTDSSSQFEVVAFSTALRPSRATGISHARLPILMRDIFRWQGLLESNSVGGLKSNRWPRVANVVDMWSKDPSLPSVGLVGSQQKSNVPAGESSMAQLSLSELPIPWSPGHSLAGLAKMPFSKDQRDPLPWITLCAWVVIGLALLELVWLLWAVFHRTWLYILLLGGLLGEHAAQARIEIVSLGDDGRGLAGFERLSKDVGHRTSLEIASIPRKFSTVSKEVLGQPWIWLAGIGPVSSKSGAIDHDVANWVRRGGMLIIENAPPVEVLKEFSKKAFHVQAQSGKWLAIPPDHEIMRSFYLLDPFPVCQNAMWNGYMFDGRIAMIAIPYSILTALEDQGVREGCVASMDQERLTRIFVNILMVALATDYKKDQIHMREILKRLR